MEVLNIDTIGPVARDSADNCYYILVVIDCFTRFVELYPVSDTSTFRVRWKGYTPDDDTWQPMKTVRETQAFVDYSTKNRVPVSP